MTLPRRRLPEPHLKDGGASPRRFLVRIPRILLEPLSETSVRPLDWINSSLVRLHHSYLMFDA
jgi:hypothetical protein